MVKPNRLFVTLMALSSLNLAAAQLAPTASRTSAEQELVKRALSDDLQAQVTLLVGQLPKDFPALPLPGIRLIGSVVTTSKTKPTNGINEAPSARVFLDMPGSVTQTSQALTAFFKKQGYQMMPMPGAYDRMTGGFQSTTPTLSWGQWYRQNPIDVITYGFQQAGGVTRVVLSRQTLPPEVLNSRLRMAAMQGDPYARLPKLIGPADSRIMGQGGGSNGDEASQSAVIETSLTLGALHDHFASQLTKAGWKLIQKGGTGKILVSLWQAPNQSLGELTLTQTSQGNYRGMIRLSGV